MVWTSPAAHPLFSNVQISLDWYLIDIADRIVTVGFQDFVLNCYDARYNPDFSVTSEWCSYFDRNAVTGHVENPRQLLRNVYDWETDGVDLQLDWQFDLGPG